MMSKSSLQTCIDAWVNLAGSDSTTRAAQAELNFLCEQASAARVALNCLYKKVDAENEVRKLLEASITEQPEPDTSGMTLLELARYVLAEKNRQIDDYERAEREMAAKIDLVPELVKALKNTLEGFEALATLTYISLSLDDPSEYQEAKKILAKARAILEEQR